MASLVSRLLDSKYTPETASFQEALKVSPQQAQALWAGLNTVDAGDGKTIPAFNATLVAAGFKGASVYINGLKQKRLIRPGDSRGKWVLVPKAEQMIENLLAGKHDKAEGDAKKAPGKGPKGVTQPDRPAAKRRGRKPGRAKQAPDTAAEMPQVGQVQRLVERKKEIDARLADLAAEQEALTAERAKINAALGEIAAVIQKVIVI